MDYHPAGGGKKHPPDSKAMKHCNFAYLP